MGQDQSSSVPGQMGHPSVPYTSYSAEKNNSKSMKSRQKATVEDIMVVNAPNGNTGVVPKSEDQDIRNLNRTPFFFPLIRTSINAPVARELDVFDKFDPRPCLSLCSRYENHLKQCADAVAFDQNMLSARIREIDAYCWSVLRRINDRYKHLSNMAIQLRKVQEVNANLKRIDSNLKRLVPMMERLNNTLPEEERLEDFSVTRFESHGIQNRR